MSVLLNSEYRLFTESTYRCQLGLWDFSAVEIGKKD